MEHNSNNSAPPFDYAAAMEEHHAKFPDSAFPGHVAPSACIPQLNTSSLPVVDARPQVAVPPKPVSSSPEGDTGNEAYPAVAAPSTARLTSTVTYSDLPGGYDRVSVVEVEVGPTIKGAEDRSNSRRWVRFLENPRSVAILVVTPIAADNFHSDVAITHRKLRYLFKDAIDWYLKEHGIAVKGGVPAEFIKVDTNTDAHDASAPVGVTYMRVSPSGLDFRAPTAEAYAPSTAGIIFALVAMASVTFLAVQVYLLAHGVGGGVYVQAALRIFITACDAIHVVIDILRQLAVQMLKLFGKAVLHFDRILARARELGEL